MIQKTLELSINLIKYSNINKNLDKKPNAIVNKAINIDKNRMLQLKKPLTLIKN